MGSGPIIGGLAAVLLVAMVVAVAVHVNNISEAKKPTTSNKAVNSLCEQTDHKDACVKSLGEMEETNPQELIKAEFKAAIEDLRESIKNSEPIQEAEKDERTKNAVKDCKTFLDYSIDDLQRSLNKMGNFDVTKMDKYLMDMEVWLSGALTFQETCRDAFENTSGDAGEKMKKLLTGSGELTSNVLAMVSQLNKVLGDFHLPNTQRKLLELNSDGEPSWFDAGRRNLLQAGPKPNVVVAQDGSGNFRTIGDAIKSVAPMGKQAFVILVKPGVYKENVEIPKKVNGIVLMGSGVDNTKITGDKSFAKGVGTFYTATFGANGDYFTAKDITFENSAGAEGHQAVALRVSGDMAVFYNCRMDGYQDTLYTHSLRQYYRDCTITGTVDYIFGDAAVVFQNCRMIVRKPGPNQQCMVTAQGRKEARAVGGTIIQNCVITGEPALMTANPPVKSYLGRPWKEFSRTIIMQSFIDKNIVPEGWSVWNGNFALDTLYYAEFGNRGPGSDTSRRVTWKGIKKITPQEAASYTPGTFLGGDNWIRITGFPYEPGMMRV